MNLFNKIRRLNFERSNFLLPPLAIHSSLNFAGLQFLFHRELARIDDRFKALTNVNSSYLQLLLNDHSSAMDQSAWAQNVLNPLQQFALQQLNSNRMNLVQSIEVIEQGFSDLQGRIFQII